MPTSVKHAFYLGAPGQLRVIPDPAPGYMAKPVLATNTHRLLSGNVRVDRAQNVMREYSFQLPYALDEEKQWAEACVYGLVGPRLALLDPNVVNQLYPWIQYPQASLRGFLTTGGSLTQNPLPAGSQSDGSVTYTPATTGQFLIADCLVPVVAALPVVASVWVNAAASATRRVNIQWLGADRSLLSTTNGSTVTTTGVNQRLTVSGNPPANAVYARMTVEAVAGTAATTLDGFQLEMVSLSDQLTGPGVAYVAITDYEPSLDLPGRTVIGVSLQEVI